MTHWTHTGRLILFVGACLIAARAPAAVVQSKSGPVNVESLVKLDNPWGMTFLPDGRLLFGPDGKLYITSGERQRFEPAQDLGTNLGKIVRINPDGSIPNDNPFVNQSGARPDVWTYGHRNPLGAVINPTTHELWINE